MSVSSEKWLEAQYSVLGSALIDSRVVPMVMSGTSETDYFGQCRTVYTAMRKLFLAGEPVDPVTVASVLGDRYSGFLLQMMEITPTAANVQRYITLCRDQARVLAVRELAQQMLDADSSADVKKLLDQAAGLMVDKPGLKITTMEDALKSFYERHTGEASYLTWPIHVLNSRLYAELGDFIVIGGYPSAGKSAWAMQCAWHFAQKYKVGFFSLETSDAKLFDRRMASMEELSMDDIKRNSISREGWDAVARSSSEIMKANLELIPAAGMSPADVRATAMMRGYQIVFIDYLQLLQGNGANRAEQVAGISMALHTMAQSMGVTVIALSQLKRKGEADTPSMSDLRESGQIEQDADLVMILKLCNDNEPEGPRNLYIAKNKEGTCPMVQLNFDGAHQLFSKAETTRQDLKAFARNNSKRRRRAAGEMEQFSMLDENTPVPFEN